MAPDALLDSLTGRGFVVDIDGDALTVAPSTKLGDDDRAAIRNEKRNLIRLILIRRALKDLEDVGGGAPALSRYPDLHLEPPGVWVSGRQIIPTRATMPAIKRLRRRRNAKS